MYVVIEEDYLFHTSQAIYVIHSLNHAQAAIQSIVRLMHGFALHVFDNAASFMLSSHIILVGLLHEDFEGS